MSFNLQHARPLLQACNLPKLFVEELGWEPCRKTLTLRVCEKDFTFKALAEKRGFTAWLCESPDGGLPDHATRLKLDRKLSETSFEHLIVFVTQDRSTQSWTWVRREIGKPLATRTHEYRRGQLGDALLQKIQILYVSLEEEEAGTLSTIGVAGRARAAFDIERITKSFYCDFDTHRKAFLKFIEGIVVDTDREWYASVMLNRLMFVYFIQSKGFLDGNPNYLHNRLDRCQKEQGKDKFYTFYRYFLLRLFHEGFAQKERSPELEALLGRIPYLNGGLFDVHELEKPERYGKDIQIPDKAFELIFDFFEGWDWVLDSQYRSLSDRPDPDRPIKEEINPDVLGFIFEKYINGIQPGEQKAKGAYYTKEDITEYISKNTVLPFLFTSARAKCKVAFENADGPTVWDLLRDNPDRYIYPAVRHGLTWNYINTHPNQGESLSEPLKLPEDITAGLDTAKTNLITRRKAWNKDAPEKYALPTETWREVVARRQYYEETKKKLATGKIRNISDFVTLNLDIRQFMQDVIATCEGPELLRAFWHAIEKVTILDPTCGSGAFLFAALNILEPLYEACIDRMEAFIADADRMRLKTNEEIIHDLIAKGESSSLEFKSTARWNIKANKADKTMEQMVIKTIAAFLNSQGGDLIVGVQDNGTILGLSLDLQLFPTERRNRDAYELWIMELLLGAFGKQYSAYLHISFARFSDGDVCRVNVMPASKAVFVKESNQDAFYVRAGNSTRSLLMSEAIEYNSQKSGNKPQTPQGAELHKHFNPQKYSDFRKIVEDLSSHSRRRYFIFKSIILNNLFGVDIMEEAVEICKLRLFLKLAAQVEPDSQRENFGIEPLPDIDFNIRSGNTLVGYATKKELESVGNSDWILKEQVKEVLEAAEDAAKLYECFLKSQVAGDQSVADFKLKLRSKFGNTRDKCDRFLAESYELGLSKQENKYANWRKGHQPFHWFVEFYSILTNGGFDVIIGNPPYVEYKDVCKNYKVQNFKTEGCSNLFAFVLERCTQLSCTGSEIGMIIPLSAFSTDRMIPLMTHLKSHSGQLKVANFSWRPGKLFDGVHLQLSILLQKVASQLSSIETTRYLMWDSEARPELFSKIEYATTTDKRLSGSIPKLGSQDATSILSKLRLHKKEIGACFTRSSDNRVLYRRGGLYWKVFVDFETGSSEEKIIHVLPEVDKYEIIAALSSGLWWWYFTITSDCRHLGNRDINSFPFDPREMSLDNQKKLSALGKNYVEDLKRNAENAVRVYKGKKAVDCLSFKVNQSKPIIDEIDTLLAQHYGFTEEELDFIINYDIKYRMGRDAESEEE